ATMHIASRSSGIHWKDATEAMELVIQRLQSDLRDRAKGVDKRNRSGWATIDRMLRYYPPKQMTTIGGRTNDGKSTLTLQIMMGIAMCSEDGTGSAYISLEDPVELNGERMIAWLCQDVEAVLRMDRGETLPQDMRSIVQVAQAYRDTIPLR